jgi:DNA-binding transcriptional ArsR family regulator
MERTESMALFVSAVEEGSLSGAARKSGLSLSSVSRHLSALEERLHVRLLVLWDIDFDSPTLELSDRRKRSRRASNVRQEGQRKDGPSSA